MGCCCWLCYTDAMGKIDEVKEVLNTLRVAKSIFFGVLVIVVGSVISRFDSGLVDIIFG